MSDIDILNSKLIFSDNKYPIDLAYGKMGICIYLFYLSRLEEKDEYWHVANKLLDDIIAKIPNHKDISVDMGLAGIGIGLTYLVKEKFVGGDINDVLEEVDSYIFKSIAFLNIKNSNLPKSILIQLIYYFYLRLTNLKCSSSKYLYQELIIKMIEMLQHNLQTNFFKEHSVFSAQDYQLPSFLYVISKIYKLNIYNQRITKIIEEFYVQIVSTIPILHANRLFLLFGLLNLKPYLLNHQKEINFQTKLLKEIIDIEHIINVEFKNKDIFVNDGLSFVYILLFMIQKNYPEYRIVFDPQSIYSRIISSEAWNTMLNKDYYLNLRKGLYDGFPGVNLVIMHIKKYFKL